MRSTKYPGALITDSFRQFKKKLHIFQYLQLYDREMFRTNNNVCIGHRQKQLRIRPYILKCCPEVQVTAVNKLKTKN